MELINIDKCKLSKTGLELNESVTFEEWQDIGVKLQLMEGSIQWWIGDWIRFGERKWGEMYAQAIEETCLDYGTLANYKYVAENVEGSRRCESLSWSSHREVASLDPKQQKELLQEGTEKNWKARDFNHVVKNIKKIETPLQEIEGKYNVFVIDPPWAYGTEYDSESRRVASPYNEKTTQELKEWGKEEFEKSAHSDSVIWLWTTHKFLPDSFELLKEWGFDYKLTMVWDKQKMGMGVWLRCQSEFCLLGVKGDYHKHWKLENERDIMSVARREHSRKPEEFYDMVNRLCPKGKKIDIFSREKHEGFEQYGNETSKF